MSIAPIHSSLLRNVLLGATLIAAGACGGISNAGATKDDLGGDQGGAGGATTRPDRQVSSDGGPVATEPGFPAHELGGGTGVGGRPPIISIDGGAPGYPKESGGDTGFPLNTGGYPTNTGGTGGAGGFPQIGGGGDGGGAPVGPECHDDILTPMSWGDHCAPSAECLDLRPSTWAPAVHSTPYEGDAGAPDGGAALGTSVAEAAFCGAADGSQKYTFAFEERGASYDSFNVVTGDAACSGRTLAFLGIGGLGDAPLTPLRTHCFSVPGSLLGSRIAVLATDANAEITNLRPVSSCPCAYPIPYNVSSCPFEHGGGGHPGCE